MCTESQTETENATKKIGIENWQKHRRVLFTLGICTLGAVTAVSDREHHHKSFASKTGQLRNCPVCFLQKDPKQDRRHDQESPFLLSERDSTFLPPKWPCQL